MRKLVGAVVALALLGGAYAFASGAKAHNAHTLQFVPPTPSRVNEGAGDHNLPVLIRIDQPVALDEKVAVDVNCFDGTATKTAPSAVNPDYTCAPQTVVFANSVDNDETLSTPIVIEGDAVGEADETFTISLFNARWCSAGTPLESCNNPLTVADPPDFTVTIANDDPLPGTVGINDASGPEGDRSESKDITFTVTLSRACTVEQGNLTVAFDTQSGTASEGVDFTNGAGTLTFVPGDMSEVIVVKTIGDNSGEPDESFVVVLGPLGGSCAPNFSGAEPPSGTSDLRGTATISNDDGPVGTVVSTSCSGNASGDFNGDGRTDLAVGSPGQAVNGTGNAGAVQVLYGASGVGLADAGKQTITQGADGVDDSAESGDQFGSCLAAGLFNDDTFWDLAAAAPGEDFTSSRGAATDAGAVNVIYGSSIGLNAAGSPADQLWTQDSEGVLGANEDRDALGNALTVGDFNNDGSDDLAIGVQSEDIKTTRDAGAVNVLPGSLSGLTSTGDKIIFQDAKRFAGSSERGDNFGAALTAGNLDGDAMEDLVVGVPGEALGNTAAAGVVQVVRANAKGLTGALDGLWFQGNSNIVDTAEGGDRFGASVAAGDFNSDGVDDVAVGIPFEDLGTRSDVGAVAILYSTTGAGPADANNELWSEADSAKITGDTPNAGDAFGRALTAGDFNGDGGDDLAVGTPGNDFAATNAGSISVLYASTTGLSGPQHFTQADLTNSTGGGEAEDAFGTALANGDYNADGRADLAVGVPREDLGTEPDAGAVNVVFGSPTGVSTAGDQFWTQDTGTVQSGGSQTGDQYGASLG